MLRDELNKAFYKDRLDELEVEAEEANQQELIADLKWSLLDDVQSWKQEMKKTHISTVELLLYPLSFLLWSRVTYGMYFKFGALNKKFNIGKKWALIFLSCLKKLMSSRRHHVNGRRTGRKVTFSTAYRACYQPKDSTGWLLLSRIALANRDAQTTDCWCDGAMLTS